MNADSLARAAADTARFAEPHLSKFGAAGLSPAQQEAFVRAVDSWHEFYLLAGTAAVTLVGLLFVALSFHLDTLLHESKAHLLASARLTFMNFVFVLILSLMFLIPDLGPGMIAIFTGMLCVIGTGFTIWNHWSHRRSRGATTHDGFLRRRLMLGYVGFAYGLTAVWQLLVHPSPLKLTGFVALVCVMLANAAGASWDLLVQVGKLRRAQEITEPK